MSVKELEKRVVALEQQVARLTSDLAATKTGRTKNWLAAVEKYTGDEDLLAVFAEAQKLREQDRKRARNRQSAARKPRT